MKSPTSRELGYLRKWVPIAILIGVVCGVGSIVFYEAIRLASAVLLGKWVVFLLLRQPEKAQA